MKAISNNCAMVMKHSIARKCRYLPVEVISRSDFQSRYPEINLDDSQSSIRNISTSHSDSDDEDDDADDDVKKAVPDISNKTPSSSLNSNQEDIVIVNSMGVEPASIISSVLDTSTSISVFKCLQINSKIDYNAVMMEQEGVKDIADDSNSFALGDSFISFSDTNSPPESKKRIFSEPEIPTSNKKLIITEREKLVANGKSDTSQMIKKAMNTPKSLKSKGKLSRRKG